MTKKNLPPLASKLLKRLGKAGFWTLVVVVSIPVIVMLIGLVLFILDPESFSFGTECGGLIC